MIRFSDLALGSGYQSGHRFEYQSSSILLSRSGWACPLNTKYMNVRFLDKEYTIGLMSQTQTYVQTYFLHSFQDVISLDIINSGIFWEVHILHTSCYHKCFRMLSSLYLLGTTFMPHGKQWWTTSLIQLSLNFVEHLSQWTWKFLFLVILCIMERNEKWKITLSVKCNLLTKKRKIAHINEIENMAQLLMHILLLASLCMI